MKKDEKLLVFFLIAFACFPLLVWKFYLYDLLLLGISELIIVCELCFIPVYRYKKQKLGSWITGMLFILWVLQLIAFLYNTFILLFVVSLVTGNFHSS